MRIKLSTLRQIIREEMQRLREDHPLATVQDPSLRRRSREVHPHKASIDQGGYWASPPDTEFEDEYLADIGQTPGEDPSIKPYLIGAEDPMADPMYDLDEPAHEDY